MHKETRDGEEKRIEKIIESREKQRFCKWKGEQELEGAERQGSGGRQKKKKKELRCDICLCQLPVIKVIIMYYKHVLVQKESQ